MPFLKLGLAPSLCTPLAHMGYREPTPVQTQSIPIVLSGTDLVARAQTGTGKTAAFGLPMVQRLCARGRSSGARHPRGLVLAPTRELAVQVHRALVAYGGPVQLRATAIFGGVPIGPQVRALRQGTDIVVATPGRLIDHLIAGRLTSRQSKSSRSTKPTGCSTWAFCRRCAACSRRCRGRARRCCFRRRCRPRSCASRLNSHETRHMWTSRSDKSSRRR